MRKPRNILPYGPTALLLTWEQKINVQISRSVHAYHRKLREWPGVIDCVPAYASLLVSVDPSQLNIERLREEAYRLTIQDGISDTGEGQLHQLPVLYGGSYGLDLVTVARGLELTEAAVVDLHTSTTYHVYQLGYLPGFAFLGSLDDRLMLPRRPSPRPRVPTGSVAIAGSQTAVYPSEVPGGWHLLGRCPLPMFDANAVLPSDYALLLPGDRVRFVSITAAEYATLLAYPNTPLT